MGLSLLHLAGTVCVLLWGSYTIRAAVEKAFSVELRKLIAGAAGSRTYALFCGAVSAVTLQSATATILLTTTFVSSGLISLAMAVVIILGADVGSAVAARVLFFDLSWLAPLCLCGGIGLHLLSRAWRLKQFGQVLVGLGLILLSIRLMKQNIVPLSTTESMLDLMVALRAAPWLSILATALLTWMAHSSVAIVLMLGALADAGLLQAELYLPMLLGANIGAGLIPYFLVSHRHLDTHSAVLTNLLLRVALAIVVLAWLNYLTPLVAALSLGAGERVIYLHLAFNGVLALLFVPVATWVSHLVKAFILSRQPTALVNSAIDPGSGLDADAISQPDLALSSSRREALRLADNTESLFARALSMFEAKDRTEIHRLVDLDKEINARNKSIQQYLSEVRRHTVKNKHTRQLDDILQFAAAMENIGDSIAYDLARLACKRIDRNVRLSAKGWDELSAIHTELLGLLKLEINHFALGRLKQDSKAQTKTDKATKVKLKSINRLCEDSIANHRQRLSARTAESLSSSSIHQDSVRAFLQVLGYIKRCRASVVAESVE